jgi:catechol 2,3-dioxygenase-like lactoylglutathione lyase family enzyme
MATVSVRFIVDDVDDAIGFYCRHLGFQEQMHPAPTFAMLTRGDLRLVLSAPGGGPGGGQAMPDGTLPSQEAGIGSRSRSRTWQAWSRGCAMPEFTSVTSWLPESAASKC